MIVFLKIFGILCAVLLFVTLACTAVDKLVDWFMGD